MNNNIEQSTYKSLLTPNLMYANSRLSQQQEADLYGAILVKADLEGAKIMDEQLKQANSIVLAIMPDGSKNA